MIVEVVYARWNGVKNSHDPPGTRIEIEEEDFPHYAAHCKKIELPPVAVVPDAPNAESNEEKSVITAPSGTKKKKAPVKRKAKKKKKVK